MIVIEKVIVDEEAVSEVVKKMIESLKLLPEEQRTLPIMEYVLGRCSEEIKKRRLLL